jgi:Spy/CpxP family protein refolding chaperone
VRFERMAEQLDLDQTQRAQVRAELDGTREQMDRLLRDSAERIRAVLDEDQQRRFDEMRRREGPRRRR